MNIRIALFHLSASISLLRFGIGLRVILGRRNSLLQESMYHLITGKCNYCRRCCSHEISCTSPVETRKPFILKDLLHTINNPCILDFNMSSLPLFLQSGAQNLVVIWTKRNGCVRQYELKHNIRNCWEFSEVPRNPGRYAYKIVYASVKNNCLARLSRKKEIQCSLETYFMRISQHRCNNFGYWWGNSKAARA